MLATQVSNRLQSAVVDNSLEVHDVHSLLVPFRIGSDHEAGERVWIFKEDSVGLADMVQNIVDPLSLVHVSQMAAKLSAKSVVERIENIPFDSTGALRFNPLFDVRLVNGARLSNQIPLLRLILSNMILSGRVDDLDFHLIQNHCRVPCVNVIVACEVYGREVHRERRDPCFCKRELLNN